MSKYEGIALLKELMAAEAGVYLGRNLIDDLGFTIEEVFQFGEEGTAIEHGFGIGDYFIMKVPNKSGVMRTYTMEIAGIDHYTDTMYGNVGHHIDWISKELADEYCPYNLTNFNNGMYDYSEDVDDELGPFSSSNIKKYLNAEAGKTADGKTVDYTTTGFLARMRASSDHNAQVFASHLKDKYCMMERRYEEGESLTEDTDWSSEYIGKLWLPTEVEIWGRAVWGDKTYGACYGTQYPIFKRNGAIAKRRTDNNSLGNWWSASVHAGSSSDVCFVSDSGYARYISASYSWIGFPVCGRT